MEKLMSITYRIELLKKLLYCIERHENDINQALYLDFNKSPFESYLSETGIVVRELKLTIKNLSKWAKPKRVFPSLLNFPSSDFIYNQPYGKVLVISPWNYPFLLALQPVIGAFSAGNSVVLKPSEISQNTSQLIQKIIAEVFNKEEVAVILGGAAIAQELLIKKWDCIFFTGSVSVGKIVANAAAQNLTPIILELGGKNPTVVDESANLKLAAKRIVWGKFLNAGQTCIAPDYIIIDEKVKDTFVDYLKQEIVLAYGKKAEESKDYPRIGNNQHFDRLMQLLQGQTILYGGRSNRETRYIEPTIVDQPSFDSKIMNEEIFGPLLPIIAYKNEEAIATIISRYEKPLAAYIFTADKKKSRKFIENVKYGGGCINDVMVHFANSNLPFGGIGNSGFGSYHGKKSYDCFTHKKAIVKKATWLDIKIRYAPYENKLELIKKILNWL
jgi:aldehyde dehydrogenase (NAD+)